MQIRTAAALAATVVAAPLAMGGVFFDEDVDGDLSNDRFNPTVFNLGAGASSFIMDVIDSDQPQGDLDYFTVVIGDGLSIDSIVLAESFNPGGGFDNVAFIALQIGPIVTVDPASPNPAPLAGFVIGSPNLIGTNILPTLAGDFGPTLGSGEYAFWVQQTGESLTRLRLDFNVVPAPGAMAVLGLAGLAGVRRRR